MKPHPLHEDLLATSHDIRNIAESIGSDRHALVLAESGLSKIWRWINIHECAVISGCRGNPNDLSYCLDQKDILEALSPKQLANAARSKKLKAMLLAKGYGVTPMLGAYIENMNTPAAKHVHETSYFVVNRKNESDFFDEIIKLGQYFCQDSVILVEIGGNARLYGTNNAEFPGLDQIHELGDFIAGDHVGKQEFHSKIKTNRPFAFAMGETIESLSRRDRYACMVLAEQLQKELIYENEDRYNRQVFRMRKRLMLQLLDAIKNNKVLGTDYQDAKPVSGPNFDENSNVITLEYFTNIVGGDQIDGKPDRQRIHRLGVGGGDENFPHQTQRDLSAEKKVSVKLMPTNDESMIPIVIYSCDGWPSLVFEFDTFPQIFKSLFQITVCYAAILSILNPEKYLHNAYETLLDETLSQYDRNKKGFEQEFRDNPEKFKGINRGIPDYYADPSNREKLSRDFEKQYAKVLKDAQSCNIGETLGEWDDKMTTGAALYPIFWFEEFRDGRLPKYGRLIKAM